MSGNGERVDKRAVLKMALRGYRYRPWYSPQV